MEALLVVLMVGCCLFWAGRISAEKAPSAKIVNIASLPLSPGQWDRFCHLAAAMGVKQSTLISEAIKFYLQEKIR